MVQLDSKEKEKIMIRSIKLVYEKYGMDNKIFFHSELKKLYNFSVKVIENLGYNYDDEIEEITIPSLDEIEEEF